MSVRKLLNQKGIDNSRIGWNNGTVLIDGKEFMRPQKVLAGTSFTDQPGFNQAYQGYLSNNVYQGGIFQPAQSGTPQERLVQYATNPQLGYNELDRAGKVYGVKNSMGDTQGANSAHSWANQVRGSMGIQNQYDPQTGAFNGNPYDRQVNDLLSKVINYKSEPIDPYSTPQYKAYQAQAQRGAEQGIRSAQESLGESGFARSTNLSDRAQRIQGDANEYLQTQAVPQIISQIQGERQQELQNMNSLLGSLMGQQENFNTNQQQVKAEKQRQAEQKFNNALSIANSLGYIPEELAPILGVKSNQQTIKGQQTASTIEKNNSTIAKNQAQTTKVLQPKSTVTKSATTKTSAANNLTSAKGSLLNYKSFNDMIADVKRMTAQEKAMLGSGGWDKLWSYANSTAVKNQYSQTITDQYGNKTIKAVTPSGFKPKSGSPLRNTLGTATAKTPATQAPVKQSAIYTEAVGILKGTKGLTKAKALQYAAGIKSDLGKDYQNVVNYINQNYK